MDAPAIRVEGLRVVRGSRRRGVIVIDGLDLTVPRGAVVGLLGPSGSGKSSLMRAVVGVQADVTGTVEVLGLPAGDARLRRRVAYVSQAPSVYADLTVAENLRYFARLLHVDDGGADRPDRARAGGPSRAGADDGGEGVGAHDDAVTRSLRTVDLTARSDRRVVDLSGGERSRVSLAVALLGRPELLVLDEPTVGLDPVLRRDLWALFRRLAAAGTTLLVSSHVMDEATRCDRLLLLRDGVLLADETLPELLARTGAADAEQAFLALAEAAPPRGVP